MPPAAKPLFAAASIAIAVLAIGGHYVTMAVRGGASTPVSRDAAALAWHPLTIDKLPDVPPPPSTWGIRYQREFLESHGRRVHLTAEQAQTAKAWFTRPAPMRWNEFLADRLNFFRLKNHPPRSARAYALLNVAIYDALLAATRARASYQRPAAPLVAPWLLSPALPVDGEPGYPSSATAAAFAAATVIGHLIPEDVPVVTELANEVGESLQNAGLAFASDVAAGRDLGMAVANRVIEARLHDGANDHAAIPAMAKLPLPKDTHGGLYRHNTPTEPLAGTWRPWGLDQVARFRLQAPPRPGNPIFDRDLAEVTAKRHKLTDLEMELADQVADSTPATDWVKPTLAAIERHNPTDLEAARLLAYWGRAQADGAIAAQDSKFYWMQMRPEQAWQHAHPGHFWQPYIPVAPATPSYPSDHAVAAGVSEAFLGLAYPDDAETFRRVANDASQSRLFAGHHFRTDLDAGRSLGQQIGKLHAEAYQAELPAGLSKP